MEKKMKTETTIITLLVLTMLFGINLHSASAQNLDACLSNNNLSSGSSEINNSCLQ